ncbi:glycerophosphodiester phosphodiesterase family protein [Mycoplasma sp. Mirounga ES2805-ORL]|uniref:glycerophosphodiester phosphodiesterase family protein n=1 Tax=Mycoplasma sp. Mirounga ES2805-ORL TaxID=754514 RepID=UPI00197C65E1|nr:glycerophosphodiester phosphodiesterase family protein [Mycoplasma sp. Mirounga ES2805-ORL]QSF13456.1 hypothetical protein JXZ90_02145 [Mycoplasma sp. Mirounga ES2805-ORL]
MNKINDKHWLITQYISHRGYHNDICPENSIKAFENSIKNGFAIELDIHILKDNKIVVFHDDSLKRMTGIDKIIEECDYEEIKSLSLKNSKEKIPLLSDVLNLVNGKVPLLIEYKTRQFKSRILEEESWKILKNYKGQFAIQSFNPYTLLWFKNNAPYVIRGQLSGGFLGEKMNIFKKYYLKRMIMNKKTKPDFINYEKTFLKQKYIKKIKKHLPVLSWIITNYEEMKEHNKDCNNFIFEGFDPRK